MRTTFILTFFLFCITSAFAQVGDKTIKGIVTDKNTREPLTGVIVQADGYSRSKAVTNEAGEFSLILKVGQHKLTFSYIGFETLVEDIVINDNQTVRFELKPASVDLKEVVVTDRKPDENVSGVQTGVEKISIESINKLPVLMGERDIIKTLELLPGVKSAGEASGGFFVRGGSADQNAIMLDNSLIYNASHMMGFFSTFNSDAIKDATLYKGAMPAQFGGRLASVLDIQTKDGDRQNYHVAGGIGLISSKLGVEGPIQKGKSSFLVSGRRTYADVMAKLSGVEDAQNTTLYFYDLNMKLNFAVGPKDNIIFTGYSGKDALGLDDVVDSKWGNLSGALRWNHLINEKWFMNTTFIRNQYTYDIKLNMGIDLQIGGKICDYTLRQDFDFSQSEKSKWKFGYASTLHQISPGDYTFKDNSKGDNFKLQNNKSWENDVYINNHLKINDNLEIEYGVRATSMSILGGRDFYMLDDKKEVIDTVHYNSGKIVKTYFNIQPRLSSVYRLNQYSSIKAAYGRSIQNMHLLSNSNFSGLMDRWESSSLYIKPQIADQLTLGYFRNFSNNEYEFSVETYYKDMQNQIDFKDYAETTRAEAIEAELLFGKGRSYGVELLLKKTKGQLTGWVGYTLSKSEKKIDGINENKWYNAMQDRTHDISIVGMYDVNEKWSLSAAWIYYTGNAVTYPSGKVSFEGKEMPYYTERNGYRAPAYHRLDLGAVCKLKDTKKFYSELSFSLYNAYGRENAYMIQFKAKEEDPSKMTVYQYSLFRFVPSISWNFKF